MKDANAMEPTLAVDGVTKLALIGTIEIVPGQRQELLTLLMAHRALCLRDEPGTLQFEVLAPDGDNTKVLLYEVYLSDGAFEVHRNSPSLAQFRKEAIGTIAKLSVTRCTLVE